MSLETANVIFALAPAPGGSGGQQANPTGEAIKMFSILGMMALVFYFMAIRPQQKKAKEHETLMKSIKPGDKILTSGGIIGAVITVKEKSVTIRSADTKM